MVIPELKRGAEEMAMRYRAEAAALGVQLRGLPPQASAHFAEAAKHLEGAAQHLQEVAEDK